MKQKYIVMEWDAVMGAYGEIESHNVANHKGMFEIIKQAKRRCAELQRENPECRYAYAVFNQQGMIVHKGEYTND